MSAVGAVSDVDGEDSLGFSEDAVETQPAPTDFGQANKFFQRSRLRQGGEPVVGRSRCAGGPFGEELLHGEGAVVTAGQIAVRGPHPKGDESRLHRGKPIVQRGLGAVPPGDLVEGRPAGNHDEVLQRARRSEVAALMRAGTAPAVLEHLRRRVVSERARGRFHGYHIRNLEFGEPGSQRGDFAVSGVADQGRGRCPEATRSSIISNTITHLVRCHCVSGSPALARRAWIVSASSFVSAQVSSQSCGT